MLFSGPCTCTMYRGEEEKKIIKENRCISYKELFAIHIEGENAHKCRLFEKL